MVIANIQKGKNIFKCWLMVKYTEYSNIRSTSNTHICYYICMYKKGLMIQRECTQPCPAPPPAPPTLLEGPRPLCLALWRQSQQLKLHHTSGHHHGPHVHLSFLQEGIIIILPQPRGRRHCVWLNLRGGVRCPLPLPLPLLFDTILLDGG